MAMSMNHFNHYYQLLRQFADSPTTSLREGPSVYPAVPGVYGIRLTGSGEWLRAGRTDASLRQRIYRNHLMGSQDGNLRAQLVRHHVCQTLEEAKDWMRDYCLVQYMPIVEDGLRHRFEHFLLAALNPRYCD